MVHATSPRSLVQRSKRTSPIRGKAALGKLVLLGENHLRTAVREYVAHYHIERNHQGLEGRLIEPPANDSGTGPIDCRDRVGGLLRFYHRQVA
jgi:putative transposase